MPLLVDNPESSGACFVKTSLYIIFDRLFLSSSHRMYMVCSVGVSVISVKVLR